MHLVNFRDRGDRLWRAGLLESGTVVPVEQDSSDDPAVRAALAAASGATLGTGEPLGPAEVTLGTPVMRPSKIVAAAGNYVDHVKEMSADGHGPLRTIHDQGFFIKAPSSLLATGGTVLLPYLDRRTDYEGELGVVIGKRASRVDEDQALDCVLGYTCLLDISLRGGEDRGYRKSFDTFTPLGPALVTADEVGDIAALELCTRVNGEIRQQAKLSQMILGVAQLISRISNTMTLLPGDLIASGTPRGVGPVAPGDHVEVSITAIGTLAVHVAARPATGAEAPIARQHAGG